MLGKKLCDALVELHESAGGKFPRSVEVHDGGLRAKIAVVECDRLAVLASEVEVWKRTETDGRVEDVLRRQAKAIAERITYLAEEFKLVELSAQDRTAQMRSAEPYEEGAERYYYELMLTDGKRVSLARYRGVAGEPGRDRVHMSLTMEILERLVRDLAKSVGAAESAGR